MLAELGIDRAFSRDAEFELMSENPEGLFLGEVLHKAFLQINERGTEAAAATAAVMFAGCAGPTSPPKKFVADHPFIFLLRDRATGLIHFSAAVRLPETEPVF